MAEPVSATSIEALLASTRVKISKHFYNSVPDRIPLLNKIKESGNLMEVLDGGRSFFESAISQDSNAVGPYRSTSTLNVNEQEGIKPFKYYPALQYASVYIDNPTLAMNNGEAAQLSILKGKFEQARSSMFNNLDEMLCGVYGTAFGGETQDFIGLQDIIADTNTSTIQDTGIDRSLAKNAKLRNQVNSTAIANAAAWNTNDAGRDLMTDLYYACTFGNEKPKLCLMTRTIYKAYSLSLQANERFVGMSSKQGGGYPILVFMNDCEVVFGDNVLDGHFYFINPNYLKFKVLSAMNFKTSEFVPAYNQDGKRALITLSAQLCSGAPKFHGVAPEIGF